MPFIRKLQKIERECQDRNVFLKDVRALSKLNLLCHLKLKMNLVTFRRSNLHYQYYKIYLSFGIKSQEIFPVKINIFLLKYVFNSNNIFKIIFLNDFSIIIIIAM